MMRLELTKLWRQNKLLPGILVLLVLMIGSLEASLYFQLRGIDTNIEAGQVAMANLTASVRRHSSDNYLSTYDKAALETVEKQITNLRHRNGYQASTDAWTSFTRPYPWLSYSGDGVIEGLHAGEVEATRQELLYMHRYHIASMLPVTLRTNPQTASTNNIPTSEIGFYPPLTERYYERGWWQIWFWATAGGLLISLSVINLFLGDILATEWEGSTDRTRWLRLQNETHTKLILTKLAVHFGLLCLLLGLALGLFLLYAWLRTGLGDLRYPIQTWVLGKRVVSVYASMTATADANYFHPLHIVFIPLIRYLGRLGVFWVSLLFFNSAITLLVNRIMRIRLLALLTLVIIPLLGLVLPTSVYNPFTYLKGDWVITNYFGYLLNQRGPVFPWIVGLIIGSGLLSVFLTLIQLPKKKIQGTPRAT
ncbi:hypothetical protein [Schleiferilactobacillus harbinensis]|uniref:hypothetical protein n=1 Tax=Schleiferilactobacillus harbinensis TaxID=304207 RepID=UPI000AFB1A6E|nr:hypothetical protein [Schleiferilactobacillus harbinensis]